MKVLSEEKASELTELLLQNDKDIEERITSKIPQIPEQQVIPTKLSEFENDKDFQTKEQVATIVEEKIKNISLPENVGGSGSGTNVGSGETIIVNSDNKYPVKLLLEKTKKEYNQGDEINLDDLVVKCLYKGENEYSVITHYATNIDEIDTRFSGLKILKVTYCHNGITVSSELPIKVILSESYDKKQYAFKVAKNGLIINNTPVVKAERDIIQYSKIRVKLKAKFVVEQNENTNYTTLGFGNNSVWGSPTVGNIIIPNGATGIYNLDIDLQKEWTGENVSAGSVLLNMTSNSSLVQGYFEIYDCSIYLTEELVTAPSKISAAVDQTRFIIGENATIADFKATVTYNTKETKTVTLDDVTTNFKEVMDTAKVGDNAVTISYTENGHTATTKITYTFYAKDLESPLPFKEMTAKEWCEKWGFGVNYGNVLDSKPNGFSNSTTRKVLDDYIKEHSALEGGDCFMRQEVAWGQPTAIADHFKMYKDAGFNCVRIPVSWCYNSYIDRDADGSQITDENGLSTRHIGKFYTCRVREVVDMALDAGLYVIINMHHEQPIIYAASTDSQMEQAYKDARTMWTEIAEKFKNYDERLSFEGFNEVDNLKSSFNYSDESGDQMNIYNQVFVDAVRSTGGNNTKRILHCPTIIHNSDESALKKWLMPTDVAENKIVMSIHDYSLTYLQDLDARFSIYEKYSEEKNVPISVNEWGTKISECGGSKTSLGYRKIHAQNFMAISRLHNVYPIWWCNNADYRLFIKSNTSTTEVNKYINQDLCEQLQEAINTGWNTKIGYRIPDEQIHIFEKENEFVKLNWGTKGYYDSFWGTMTLAEPISTEGMLNKKLTVKVECTGLASDLWLQLAQIFFLQKITAEDGSTSYEVLSRVGIGYHGRTYNTVLDDKRCTHILISLNAAQTNIKPEQMTEMFNAKTIKLQVMCYIDSDIKPYQYNYRTLSSISAEKEKVIYNIGDVLNTDDIITTAKYNDGWSRDVKAEIDTSSVDMSKKGSYQIVLKYKEDNDNYVTTTIEILVGQMLQSITAEKQITSSKFGTSIDTSDIVVTAHYTDGSSEVVSGWTVANINDIDISNPQNVDLIIEYTDTVGTTRTAFIPYVIYDKIVLLNGSNFSFTIGEDAPAGLSDNITASIVVNGLQNYAYGMIGFGSDVDKIYANAIATTENNSSLDLFIPTDRAYYGLSFTSGEFSKNTVSISETNPNCSKTHSYATVKGEFITDSNDRKWIKLTFAKLESSVKDITVNRSNTPVYYATEDDLGELER